MVVHSLRLQGLSTGCPELLHVTMFVGQAVNLRSSRHIHIYHTCHYVQALARHLSHRNTLLVSCAAAPPPCSWRKTPPSAAAPAAGGGSRRSRGAPCAASPAPAAMPAARPGAPVHPRRSPGPCSAADMQGQTCMQAGMVFGIRPLGRVISGLVSSCHDIQDIM